LDIMQGGFQSRFGRSGVENKISFPYRESNRVHTAHILLIYGPSCHVCYYYY
jgi:hypothetical protein